MRESLSVELREIITGEGITSIYVTHDQDEAFAVADQIGVMIQGSLRRIDTPEAVWRSRGMQKSRVSWVLRASNSRGGQT